MDNRSMKALERCKRLVAIDPGARVGMVRVALIPPDMIRFDEPMWSVSAAQTLAYNEVTASSLLDAFTKFCAPLRNDLALLSERPQTQRGSTHDDVMRCFGIVEALAARVLQHDGVVIYQGPHLLQGVSRWPLTLPKWIRTPHEKDALRHALVLLGPQSFVNVTAAFEDASW